MTINLSDLFDCIAYTLLFWLVFLLMSMPTTLSGERVDFRFTRIQHYHGACIVSTDYTEAYRCSNNERINDPLEKIKGYVSVLNNEKPVCATCESRCYGNVNTLVTAKEAQGNYLVHRNMLRNNSRGYIDAYPTI